MRRGLPPRQVEADAGIGTLNAEHRERSTNTHLVASTELGADVQHCTVPYADPKR